MYIICCNMIIYDISFFFDILKLPTISSTTLRGPFTIGWLVKSQVESQQMAAATKDKEPGLQARFSVAYKIFPIFCCKNCVLQKIPKLIFRKGGSSSPGASNCWESQDSCCCCCCCCKIGPWGGGTIFEKNKSPACQVESAEDLARTLAKKRTLNWFVRGWKLTASWAKNEKIRFFELLSYPGGFFGWCYVKMGFCLTFSKVLAFS